MKDSSKTRKLLADLRKLYVDSRCEKHNCRCCQGRDLSCTKCTENYIKNDTERQLLKEQLKKLPHIPNKKEAKQLRQKKARQRK